MQGIPLKRRKQSAGESRASKAAVFPVVSRRLIFLFLFSFRITA